MDGASWMQICDSRHIGDSKPVVNSIEIVGDIENDQDQCLACKRKGI